jgi:hypothetical protein
MNFFERRSLRFGGGGGGDCSLAGSFRFLNDGNANKSSSPVGVGNFSVVCNFPLFAAILSCKFVISSVVLADIRSIHAHTHTGARANNTMTRNVCVWTMNYKSLTRRPKRCVMFAVEGANLCREHTLKRDESSCASTSKADSVQTKTLCDVAEIDLLVTLGKIDALWLAVHDEVADLARLDAVDPSNACSAEAGASIFDAVDHLQVDSTDSEPAAAIGKRRKHAMQCQSIAERWVQSCADSTNADTASAVLVEFCAGTGLLSSVFCRTGVPFSFVLIDRQSFKKMSLHDNVLKNFSRKHSTFYSRLTADVCHVTCASLRELVRAEQSADAAAHGGVQLVGCGKHLCGPATDATLALMTASRVGDDANGDFKFTSCVIAPCCHHLLRTKAEVLGGREMFTDFVEDEFEVLCKMTSWATNALADGAACELATLYNTRLDFALPLDGACKIAVGKRCKALIDLARVRHLRTRWRNVRMDTFTDCSVESTLITCI